MTSVTPLEPTITGTGPWVNERKVVWEACGESGVVEVGFVSDFASTPRILWPIFPPMGKYSIAALAHDDIYKFNKFKRKVCDKIFLELMVFLDVKPWARNTMYSAVRMGGWRPYRKHEKRLKAERNLP